MTDNMIRAGERSVMYQLLASFYLQTPSVEKIKLELELLQDAKEIFTEVDFYELIEEAKDRYEQVYVNLDAIDLIKQEHYDYLSVPISPNFVPPYESSIVGAKKSKNTGKRNKGGWDYNKNSGVSTFNVELAYKTVGFNPSKLNISQDLKRTTRIDHIGFELAFMAFLNEGEEESDENVNWYKLQTQFLNDHLMDFTGKYSEILSERSNGFYSNLSKMTASFIRWDLDTRKIQEVK
jgi:TorA maturation chaperone TorD